MKRRQMLVGLGGLSVGGALTIGTGAFTSVEADRGLSVGVKSDEEALLQLKARDGRWGVQEADGTLNFQIPGSFEEADGVGTDSVYRFGHEYENNKKGLFTVRNQGDRTVGVYSSHTASADQPSVHLYDVETDTILDSPDKAVELAPGSDTLYAGLVIDTHNVDVQSDHYKVGLTIHAATEEER